MKIDQFLVEVSHRPRTIAFLLDPDKAVDAMLDEIVDFNVCCWGGRHNPIIPVTNGEIAEPYWQLMKIVDADLLYPCCDLTSETIQRIVSDLCPFGIENLGRSGQFNDEFRQNS